VIHPFPLLFLHSIFQLIPDMQVTEISVAKVSRLCQLSIRGFLSDIRFLNT
jgi:hypothetical protein